MKKDFSKNLIIARPEIRNFQDFGIIYLNLFQLWSKSDTDIYKAAIYKFNFNKFFEEELCR